MYTYSVHVHCYMYMYGSVSGKWFYVIHNLAWPCMGAYLPRSEYLPGILLQWHNFYKHFDTSTIHTCTCTCVHVYVNIFLLIHFAHASTLPQTDINFVWVYLAADLC